MRPIDHLLLQAAEHGDFPAIQKMVCRTLDEHSRSPSPLARWASRKGRPNFHVLKPGRPFHRERRAWAGEPVVQPARGAFDLMVLPYDLPGRPPAENARRLVDIHLTPLVLAVRGNHLQCVKALLPHSPLGIQSLDGVDALVLACEHDFEACTQAILLEARRRDQLPLLNLAFAVRTAIERHSVRSLRYLLQLGDLSANILMDALHQTTSYGSASSLRVLVAHSPRLATAIHPHYANTPLMNACLHGDAVAVQLLLPCGKLDRRNADGHSALGIAIARQKWACVEALSAAMTPEEMRANLHSRAAMLALEAPACWARFEHSVLSASLQRGAKSPASSASPLSASPTIAGSKTLSEHTAIAPTGRGSTAMAQSPSHTHSQWPFVPPPTRQHASRAPRRL